MGYPLKRELRSYFLKRLFLPLVWAVFWYMACYFQIDFFYGPGKPFTDEHAYLFGVICGVDMTGICISTAYFIVRLVSLLHFKGRIAKSMKKYLSPEFTESPFDLLEQDIQYKLLGETEIYIGNDWIVFPGCAMYRDAVAGIFYEVLSESYLSKKVRLTLADTIGSRMYVDIAAGFHPTAYQYLREWHPYASYGTFQSFLHFQNQQMQESPEKGIDYGKLQTMPVTAAGVSKWDKSAILEDNTIHCEYERWLLAAYSTYLIDIPLCHNNFTYAGGFERTAYQKEAASEILSESWGIQNRLQLLAATKRLEQAGQAKGGGKADGWQLGRSIMLWGFGYISGICGRADMLKSSLNAAVMIQQSFSGWKEMLDSHMEGYEAWSKSKPAISRRRKAYRKMLKDPASIINTVPFQSDLKALCHEALKDLGIHEWI